MGHQTIVQNSLEAAEKLGIQKVLLDIKNRQGVSARLLLKPEIRLPGDLVQDCALDNEAVIVVMTQLPSQRQADTTLMPSSNNSG